MPWYSYNMFFVFLFLLTLFPTQKSYRCWWLHLIIYLTQLLNTCNSFEVFERILRAILSKSDNSKIILLLIMSTFHFNCMFWLESIYLRIKKDLIISNAVFSYYNQRSIFVLHLSVWVPCVPSRPFSTGNI